MSDGAQRLDDCQMGKNDVFECFKTFAVNTSTNGLLAASLGYGREFHVTVLPVFLCKWAGVR